MYGTLEVRFADGEKSFISGWTGDLVKTADSYMRDERVIGCIVVNEHSETVYTLGHSTGIW